MVDDSSLVDNNLSGASQDAESKEESEIDRLVYQLYGLTEEEIKIVEGKE